MEKSVSLWYAACEAVSISLVCSSHPRRSLPARFHSSSTATAQVPLLSVVHTRVNSVTQTGDRLCSSIHTPIMVQCPSCTADIADKFCTQEAKLCWSCCTAVDDSCPQHFRMLPKAVQMARLSAEPENQKQPQPPE